SPRVEAIAKGCDYATLVAADPADMPAARKLALIVRPAIVARSGKLFVWSDWNAKRVTPWLAASLGARGAMRTHGRKSSGARGPSHCRRADTEIETRDHGTMTVAELERHMRERRNGARR